ncbi:MAG: protein-glutamate O-methyltransferase CheR [Deltaproteobacteria bacterium]|nr:protein-glutamate O-methyltransferase CheR [Deltaproteobacteria bacterium]
MDDPLAPLLAELLERKHCDFRGYARPSLERGVERARAALGVASVDELAALVCRDPAALTTMARALTTSVSELFRDPSYFRAWRDEVMPLLATYPSIRVWVAGCGAGEEAYSIAVILAEAGLLDRALVYATDIDEHALAVAASGAYPAERLPAFERNYRAAGGRARLSDHVRIDGATLHFDAHLRARVSCSEHSLSTDGAFAEVHAVSCRNVLIYFARELRDRALALFLDALCPRGVLGLGATESLALSEHGGRFHPFVAAERLYRRA